MRANLKKKNLMVDKFSKMTYIKDQRKLIESDLYIGPEGVIQNPFQKLNTPKSRLPVEDLIKLSTFNMLTA